MSVNDAERAVLRLRWRTVAIVSALVNVAVISAIIVLALVKKADGLSTVALSLAVLSFIGQLVIFVVQSIQGVGQVNLARELNSSTFQLVTEAKARIDGTNEILQTLSRELRQLKILKSSEGEESDHEIQTGQMPVALPRQTLGESSPVSQMEENDSAESLPFNTGVSPIDGGKEKVLELLTWPTTLSEAEASLVLFETLSESQRIGLFSNTSLEIYYLLGLSNRGAILKESIDIPLIERGLSVEVESRLVDGKLNRFVGTTDLGLSVARILFSAWPPSEELASIKERLWAVRMSLGDRGNEVLYSTVKRAKLALATSA